MRLWEIGDVSRAWSIWWSASEAALADAYQFSGGPVLDRDLVLGRGAFLVRTVRLGGPEVRRALRNFEGSDVFMYHDASTAVLLDLRRRFKAVVDVLRAVIRDGVTLARSLDFTVQWDGILRIGPVFPTTLQDLDMARNGGLGVLVASSLRASIVGYLILFMEQLCIAGRRLSRVAELVEGGSPCSFLQVAQA